jgi:23S rRNA (cytosine1962-C5)-methyltransferase
VEHYCDVIFPHVTENRFLSVDYYPLYADGTMKTEWLYTYENIAKAAKDAHKRLRQIEFRTQAPDHPILWASEESYYLKFYIFQVVEEK